MEALSGLLGSGWELFRTLMSAEGLQHMLKEWGWVAYLILFAIIFAETGLLVGFCLPGDSLLFIAGFLCSAASGYFLNVWLLIPLLIVAAITGDALNYWLGWKAGPRIFCKEDSLFFHKKHLLRTQKFYEKYGGRTIIYARFVPIVRTFAPFIAGVGKMDYRRFLSFNVFGGIGWVVSLILAGYFLGNIPVVKNNLEKAVLLVIFISVLPILIEMIKARFGKEELPEVQCAPDGTPLVTPIDLEETKPMVETSTRE